MQATAACALRLATCDRQPLGTVLYCAIAPIVAAIVIRRLIIAGVLIGMLFVMRRGYVLLAGAITVTGIWIILTFAAYTSGGMRAPAIGGYLIVVLSAGLLLGRQAAIGAAGASALAGLAFVYAGQAGSLPAPNMVHRQGFTVYSLPYNAFIVGTRYIVSLR